MVKRRRFRVINVLTVLHGVVERLDVRIVHLGQPRKLENRRVSPRYACRSGSFADLMKGPVVP
jgi:hypothetical protein